MNASDVIREHHAPARAAERVRLASAFAGTALTLVADHGELAERVARERARFTGDQRWLRVADVIRAAMEGGG